MNRSALNKIIQEELANLTTEAVPSNIQSFANRKGDHAKRLVRQVDGWANKIGKRITGGTAVGKNYSTLILDLTHQGGEISIDLDEETIEVQGEPVESFKEFEMAVMNLTNEGTVKEAVEYVDKDSPESKIVVRGFGNYITLMQKDFDDKTTTTFVVGTQQIAELIKVLNKFK